VFRFELKGAVYLNNTIVVMEDIGEGPDALHCYSTYDSCCSRGDLHFPNGSSVLLGGHGRDLYKSSDVGTGFIQLNRKKRVTSPSGRYQCVLPMRNGLNASLFINIGKPTECLSTNMAKGGGGG